MFLQESKMGSNIKVGPPVVISDSLHEEIEVTNYTGTTLRLCRYL